MSSMVRSHPEAPIYSGMEQLAARLVHAQEVTGSSPVPATSRFFGIPLLGKTLTLQIIDIMPAGHRQGATRELVGGPMARPGNIPTIS